ncbi:MAG: protease inhibitor I42 family protein [Gammaproteobacteria bacterium]
MLKRVIVAFLLMGFAWGAQALEVKHYTENATTIMVNKDQPSFILDLKANVTTGFQWFLIAKHYPLIKEMSYQYIAPAENRPGAGGVAQWTVTLSEEAFAVPQTMNLNFIYSRPWSKSVGKHKTIRIVTLSA